MSDRDPDPMSDRRYQDERVHRRPSDYAPPHGGRDAEPVEADDPTRSPAGPYGAGGERTP